MTAAQIAQAEKRALAAYAEPGRFYHGIAHVEDCLRKLEAIQGLSPEDIRILRLAIIWHDVVYDATRSDNEEQSAIKARQDLSAVSVSPQIIDEVTRLILLTTSHQVAAGDRLGELLVSIDLSILGSDPAAYDNYAAGIRSEYTHVPDDAYRAGRGAVLRKFLDADVIFPHAEFRLRYENSARSNIQRELGLNL